MAEGGLSFWERKWGATAGLLILPLAITFGVIVAVGPFDNTRIGPASGMIVSFASFLSGGWTFGFSFFWSNVEKDLRDLRRGVLDRRHEAAKGFDVDALVTQIQMPFWTFIVAMFGLVLMVLSAILAVGAEMYQSGLSALLALGSLVLGFSISFASWIESYAIRRSLTGLAERAPRRPQQVESD